MDFTIKQIILILFITFPVMIHSKNSCPNSSCGSSSLTIKYPFKLETDQLPLYCYSSINLRCDDQGNTLINLPYFGEFYVTDINYYHRKIAITDPGNCLSRRLMTNFSVEPLSAYSYESYTFYSCPEERAILGFSIPCLSNSTNVTVVMPADSSEPIGCNPIVSSMIPVSLSSQYDDWEKFGYLELTWNFPPCKQCELRDDPEKPGDNSKSKFVKLIFGSTVFIPLATIFTTFFAIASFIRILKLIVGSATTDNPETGNSAEDASTAMVAPPQASGGGPPGTTCTMPGTETSKVKYFSQVVVRGESHLDTLTICSICLEEYNGKDRVTSLAQCGHLFHAECIDQWLQKNTTCPICRTSLSDF